MMPPPTPVPPNRFRWRAEELLDAMKLACGEPLAFPEDVALAEQVARMEGRKRQVHYCRCFTGNVLIVMHDGRRYELPRDDTLQASLAMIFSGGNNVSP